MSPCRSIVGKKIEQVKAPDTSSTMTIWVGWIDTTLRFKCLEVSDSAYCRKHTELRGVRDWALVSIACHREER